MSVDFPDPFFYGSSEHKLNSKGQLAVPKRFRAVVPEDQRDQGFVLLRGEGACLYMYTHRQFREVQQRVRAVAQEQGDAEFYRRFMESVHAVDLDNQGRFVLPAGLRSEIGLTGPAVQLIGMDDRIEIWPPAARDAARDPANEYEERRTLEAKRIFGL